jgi:hypothetical protein
MWMQSSCTSLPVIARHCTLSTNEDLICGRLAWLYVYEKYLNEYDWFVAGLAMMIGWLVDCLIHWLIVWLVGWLVDCLACWLVS